MNILFRNALRRTSTTTITGSFQCMTKQSYQTSSKIYCDIPVSLDTSPIMDDAGITKLVQRNIVPMADIMPKVQVLEEPKPLFEIIRKRDVDVVEKVDVVPTKEIVDPQNEDATGGEKKAHTMLIIKRRKMKRHKYEKYQRKYKFQNLAKRRKRNIRREDKFRNEIRLKLRGLESFSPEDYVQDKLDRANMYVLPLRIHGTRMPPFAVKEWLQKKENTRKFVSEYKVMVKDFVRRRGSLNIEEANKK